MAAARNVRSVAWFSPLGILLCLSLGAPAYAAPTASGANVPVSVTVHDGKVFVDATPVVELPAGVTDAKVRGVSVGEGTVFHVHATDKDRTWEALVSPGATKMVLFSGYTGLGTGTVGDRTGSAVDIREGAPGTVLVGELSERASLCGQGLALLRPKMFVAKTAELAAVSMHRLSESVRAKAVRINAVAPSPEDPRTSAHLLDLGQSSDGSMGDGLLDGNPKTTWSETKKGDGHGEFVSFRVATSVPLERISFALPGEDKERELRAPKSVYVATDKGVFRVNFPKNAEGKPGTFVASFPTPQSTTCLAVTLDEAFSAKPTPLAVALADVSVSTALDSRSARDLASDLDGPDGDGVVTYLERVDGPKFAQVLGYENSFGPAGKARALALALARPGCSDQGAFLVAHLADAEKQTRERARAKLERCGKGATEALRAGVTRESAVAAGEAAGLLALIAPSQSVLPIADAIGKAPPEARAPFRHALSRALRSASPEALSELLGRVASSPAEVDVLRAASTRLPEVFGVASAALLRVLGDGASSWETRYVLLPSLIELVRVAPKGSPVTQVYEKLLTLDASDPVRARAAELAGGVGSLRTPLEGALADKSPRVRREATLSLGKLGAPDAAAKVLGDRWPFVRAEALLTLRNVASPSPSLVASVAKRLKDDSPAVRAAAIVALGKYRAVAYHDALVGILYDDDEMSDVRILAARGLGEMCSHEDVDRLSKLARASASPVQSQLERDVAFAAIEALGDLHPKDLKERLAPVLAMGPKAQARAAAERAIAAKGTCPSK